MKLLLSLMTLSLIYLVFDIGLTAKEKGKNFLFSKTDFRFPFPYAIILKKETIAGKCLFLPIRYYSKYFLLDHSAKSKKMKQNLYQRNSSFNLRDFYNLCLFFR